MTTYETSCHCGNISLALQGEPKSVMCCHCSSCRRSMGSPFVLVGVWLPDDCTVTAKEPMAVRQTSKHLGRHRCPTCGAAIFNAVRTERFSSNNVALGLFGALPDGWEVSHHIYYADRVIDVEDGKPKFDGFGIPKKSG